MTQKKFHQFVIFEKGPINTAIIDLLKGNVYQIGNQYVEKFQKGEYQEISDFIQRLESEELCFDASPGDWIPNITLDVGKDDSFYVKIEDEADLNLIRERFSDFSISISTLSPLDKDFNRCLDLLKHRSIFPKIDESFYIFNRNFNTCWGKEITILKDGTVRPCFHSGIILGNLFQEDVYVIIDKAREYWELTLDKVMKCKCCELRYVCFDCREIASRENGDIFSPNPFCNYDPFSGTWSD